MSKFSLPQLLFFIVSLTLAGSLTAQQSENFNASFEEAQQPAPDWKIEGDVTIDSGDSYHGGKSLKLSRTAEKAHLPVAAVSKEFKAAEGIWEVRLAGKADIYTPDNSFNGKVWVECLDAADKVLERFPVASFDRQKEWTLADKKVEFPAGSTSARFVVEMNKAYGTFKVDGLIAKFSGAGRSATETVDKILFQTAQMGNLLYPEDPKKATVTVETFKPLATEFQQLSYVIRDYWGAEQNEPGLVTLKEVGPKTYEAEIDFSKVPIEIGRYYEIQATVPSKEGPASNYSSFAILPKAATKQYPADQIPFTSRNWDNRIEEFYPLTDRLGVRICGIWGRWSTTPPYEAQAQRMDLIRKYDLGVLTTTPVHAIEHQRPGWEKYDEKCLREGIRNLLALIGDVRPIVINLGNEPPGNDMEVIKRDVAAYKIVYDEIKKIDPTIFVLGSSAGPNENFFKEGFGEWCDAYDFHTYEDSKYIRTSIKKYRELFAKYGFAKPIWATEVGLNSQGIERRAVSADMIKKITGFFAEGGANVSWFGLLYPDPDLKLTGGSEDCHNVFDCRYKRYAPKLDAITYYALVNGICVKKFVGEKNYPDGTYAALFRDADGNSLQVLWRDSGLADVFVPLAAGDANVRRIDGRSRTLNAQNKGVTLTVGPDPTLVYYQSAATTLPEQLGEAAARWNELPDLVVGAPAKLQVTGLTAGLSAELTTPPLWTTSQSKAGDGITFDVRTQPNTKIREADLLVLLKNAEGVAVGEMARRVIVSPRVGLTVRPEPDAGQGKPGVRVTIKNRGTSDAQIGWQIEIEDELALKDGKFVSPEPTNAKFDGETSGSETLEPGDSKTKVIPMTGVDPNKLYRVKTVVKETDGTTLTNERLVGGFVGVPWVDTKIELDGELNESAWAAAKPAGFKAENHYYQLKKANNDWKDANDLSAKVRFLWDKDYLYVGAEVTDDVAGNLKQDSAIWSQDGLQFLIDPARESPLKPGKYDYAMAVGAKGPQAWSYLTADASVAPPNECPDIRFVVKNGTGGNKTYEMAIPWKRIAPFKPQADANLGLTMILNEDDGKGRESFMAWFGNAHTKQVDTAGDLILLPK